MSFAEINKIVDVSELKDYGISYEKYLELEQAGKMCKAMTWDSHTGYGLSWDKEDIVDFSQELGVEVKGGKFALGYVRPTATRLEKERRRNRIIQLCSEPISSLKMACTLGLGQENTSQIVNRLVKKGTLKIAYKIGRVPMYVVNRS